MSRRRQKRRSARGQGERFGDSYHLGAVDFTPPQHIVDLVSGTGFVYAIWRRGQKGYQLRSIQDLPSALIDPKMLFICSPPEATRRACRLLLAHLTGKPN